MIACSFNVISVKFRPADVGQQVEASIVHLQMWSGAEEEAVGCKHHTEWMDGGGRD